MKIKLTRALWNNKAGAVLDLPEDRANWAVNRCAAEFAPKNAKADFVSIVMVEKYKEEAAKAKAAKPQKNKADQPKKNK